MSLLLHLRERTREAHERLEEGLAVLDRCHDRTGYGSLLSCLRSVYAPLERAVGACPATGSVVPDWSERRKTGWLDEDLALLGVAAPPDAAVPDVTTAEDVAGAAYVMEGATLGGAFVLRRLESAWDEPLPHRFFASYGAERGHRWREFRRRVDAAPLEVEAVVAAADRTFAAFDAACLAPQR